MSGGHFDYNQDAINSIIQDLSATKRALVHYAVDEERFKRILDDAEQFLKIAYIFSQRIDWFLSGDDGDESLYERLNEELSEIGFFKEFKKDKY